MKKTTILIILVFLISLAGCQQKAEPAAAPAQKTVSPNPLGNISTLTFDEQGIRVKYPSTYNARKDFPNTIVVLQNPAGIVSFAAKDLENTSITLDEYSVFNIEQKNKSVEDFKIIGMGNLTLAGLPGYGMVFSGKTQTKDQELVFKRAQLWTVKDGKAYMAEYIISITAQGKEIPSDVKTMQKIISTLEITG
jgi:hypothetical protein